MTILLPVVHVPHKQRFCGEGIRLHLHICPCHLIDEAGLAHVGEATHQDSPGVGVDGGKPGEMLPHLLEILQALVLPLHDSAHPPHAGLLQLLAPVERVPVLHETYVVL